MALVLETGAGVAGANSYADRTYADAYFTARGGNATWTALTNDQKDEALIKATDYVESRFQMEFVSEKNKHINPLSWPRLPVYDRLGRVRYDSDDIPDDLKKAVCEYAVRASAAALVSDPSQGLEVTSSTKKIGPLEKTEKFATRNNNTRQKSAMVKDSAFKEYPAADLLIEPLLRETSVQELSRM